MSTKIGWPGNYCSQGGWVLTGYVAMLLCVGIAVALMLGTRKRDSGGPLMSTIGLLVAAAAVLQFLPRAESGVQFVPISPWSYSGWMAFLLSLVVWISLGLAVIPVVGRALDAPTIVSNLILFSMAISGLLSFAIEKEMPRFVAQPAVIAVGTGRPSEVNQYQEQVENWREKKARMENVLKKLLSDHQRVVAEVQEVETDAVRAELAEELRDLDRRIRQVRHEIETMGSVIARVKSRLRRLDRSRLLSKGVVGDRDCEAMSEALRKLEEQLRAEDVMPDR